MGERRHVADKRRRNEEAPRERGNGLTAGHVGVQLWQLAQNWRCRVDAELEPLGLTLVDWRILEGTRRLIDDSGDAVSQTAVALHTQMDRMAMSRAMSRLERRGLVDRGPDLVWPAYRIWLTSRGERAREQAGALVEVASRAVLGGSYAKLAAWLGRPPNGSGMGAPVHVERYRRRSRRSQ